MTLKELADWEERLMDALPPGGHFEDRVVQIEAARLPEQWRQIVDGYADLFDDPVAGAEALRRAVFLVWYSWNEPWAITGIRKLASEVEEHVLARLDQELACDDSDAELCSMLSAYGLSRPFDRHPELKALTAFFASRREVAPLEGPQGIFHRRGALGRYWLSRR